MAYVTIHCLTQQYEEQTQGYRIASVPLAIPMTQRVRALLRSYAILTDMGWTSCVNDLQLWLQLPGVRRA